jgi:hypothetical protein
MRTRFAHATTDNNRPTLSRDGTTTPLVYQPEED